MPAPEWKAGDGGVEAVPAGDAAGPARRSRVSSVAVAGVVMALLALLILVALPGDSLAQLRAIFSGPPAPAALGAVTEHDSPVRAGTLAPDFELADVTTGEPVKLSALRGRPVWINFWATWCPPCKTELPAMKQLYDRYRDDGLIIVGIDMREDPVEIREFAAANGFDWSFVVDADGKVSGSYYIPGIPSHFFLDSDGMIRATHLGPLETDAMEDYIETIISGDR